MSDDKQSPIEWLKTYWFIFVAILAIGSAYGETRIKVSSIEEAVKANSQTQQDVSRLDERTKMMQEEQKAQREMLQKMLDQQTQMSRRLSR